MENKEELSINPSQWVNIIWHLIGSISFGAAFAYENYLLIIPVIIWLWKAVDLMCLSYTFIDDSETLIEKKGVFNVETVEIHYFRIKSIRVNQNLFQRIVGIYTISVITSEPFRPILTIYSIPYGNEIAAHLEELAKYWRDVKGVKETDFHNF